MQPLIGTLDRAAFRIAARTSLVADGAAGRPSHAELRDEELRQTIFAGRMRHHLRSQWVDAIVASIRSDILAARRHA